MINVFLLGVGSLLGGLARYGMTGVIHNNVTPTFPYGTLAVNVAGCFLIGVLSALSEVKLLLGPQARIMLMTGFCGAFTTFSTIIFESMHLAKNGEFFRMGVNVGGSIVLGFAAFMLADMLIKSL